GGCGMVEVDGNQWLVAVGQNTFKWPFGSRLQNLVHFLYSGAATRYKRQVDHRYVNSWYAYCETIKLAIKLGQYQPHSSGRTGFSGDHAHGGRASATQVFMCYVS